MTTQLAMPMRHTGSVAPAAYVRRDPWSRAMAPVSAAFGLGLGLGSPNVCVTSGTDHNQATEIDTKAHGARRLLETPT